MFEIGLGLLHDNILKNEIYLYGYQGFFVCEILVYSKWTVIVRNRNRLEECSNYT